MILKTLTRTSNSSVGSLVKYVLKENPDLNGGMVLPWNVAGQSVDEFIQSFQENESHRLHNRKGSVKLSHVIISIAPDDQTHVDIPMLEAMALKYIELRGIQGQYLAVAHQEKDHKHLHIVESGLQFQTGKSMRISKEEHKDLRIQLQAFQQEQFPELQFSIADHGRADRDYRQATDREHRVKLLHGTYRREILQETVAGYLDKAESLEDWLSTLADNDMQPYTRGGKVYGIEAEGRRFRFSSLGIDAGRVEELTLKNHRTQQLSQLRLRGKESPDLDRD